MTIEDKGNEERTLQPTYVLAPGYYPGFDEDSGVSLTDYVAVLWKRRLLIILGTLGCGFAAFLLSQFLPSKYEATATLLIQPPQFSSELRLAPLSVETHQSIVESDYIADSVLKRLNETGKHSGSEASWTLSTSIYASKDREQAFRPIIELTARAGSPELAQLVANTWAEVYVQENSNIATQGTSRTIDFIESQYPIASEKLEEQARLLRSTQESYSSSQLRLETKWTNRILEFSSETETLKSEFEKESLDLETERSNESERQLREHEKETERLKLDFLSRKGPDILRQEMRVMQDKLALFRDRLLDTEVELKTKRDLLVQLKQEIHTQPRLLVLSKAITDEALWSRFGEDGSGALSSELDGLKLRTELINPTYQNLLDQLTRAQVDYETLAPQKRHLETEIERLTSSLEQLRLETSDRDLQLFDLTKDRQLSFETLSKRLDAEIEGLRRNRAAAYETLIKERQAQMELLAKTRDSELSGLELSRDFEVERLTRERDANQVTFETLAQKFQAAQLAKADEDLDVKIGARAVALNRAVSPRPLLNSVVALAVGLMICIMSAFILEFIPTGSLSK